MTHHRSALEAELIQWGLRLRDLGTDEFTFRDLFVIINNLGLKPSPLNVALHGEKIYTLSYEMQLLHSIEYQTRISNYAQTKDAERKRNTPYPMNLPGYPQYGPKKQEVDSTPHDEVTDLFFKDYSEDEFLT